MSTFSTPPCLHPPQLLACALPFPYISPLLPPLPSPLPLFLLPLSILPPFHPSPSLSPSSLRCVCHRRVAAQACMRRVVHLTLLLSSPFPILPPSPPPSSCPRRTARPRTPTSKVPLTPSTASTPLGIPQPCPGTPPALPVHPQPSGQLWHGLCLCSCLGTPAVSHRRVSKCPSLASPCVCCADSDRAGGATWRGRPRRVEERRARADGRPTSRIAFGSCTTRYAAVSQAPWDRRPS